MRIFKSLNTNAKEQDKQKYTIYTDGASRGNPGKSASGFMVLDSDSKKLAKKAIYNGIKTNNYAEYTAVIKALEWCESNLKSPESSELKFVSDSELVIRQLNGKYKIRSPEMQALNSIVMDLAKWFKSVKFTNKLRSDKGISEVDKMLNELLDSK